jgi:hypothetical protein
MPPPDRKRIRTRKWTKIVTLALGSWLLLATPSFAFIFGEPLPHLPPNPSPNNAPPPLTTLSPTPTENAPPVIVGGVESLPPDMPITGISSTPEPASIVAGLIGAGVIGLLAARRRIARS